MATKLCYLPFLAFGFVPALQAESPASPTLIVQITVDGLRADLLNRYAPSFGPDGFRRLMDQGVWYTDAHHMHANTETIVGHATLATGAHPAGHGMIGNAWLDRPSGQLAYNIEDPNHPILQVFETKEDSEQLDPAQLAAGNSGRSPLNMFSTTFADELIKSNNGRSKAFGISGKDRSAVAMAGHAGKAFWMSTSTGAFETSDFYYDAYPDWVAQWNNRRPADAAIGTSWELKEPLDSYLLADNDDRLYEADLRGFGRTFPHPYGDPSDGLYYTQVLVSPLGDELVADFGKAAVLSENLGGDEWPDYLSLSFSGVDATNHFFGPSSLENEEMVRALDRVLADLFRFLDKQVGADKVIYVLSADHGMPEMPEYATQQGFPAMRIFAENLQDDLNAAVSAAFGVENVIRYFFRPYIYLNSEAIEAAGQDQREIERLIVDHLEARPEVSIALPTTPFPHQVDHPLSRSILNNFNPLRSGDIYVAPTAYTYLINKSSIAVMHGSPWAYDSHVPIIFAGPGIKAQKISRKVPTVDVAVTLSNMFGVTLPSAASGEALHEVLDR